METRQTHRGAFVTVFADYELSYQAQYQVTSITRSERRQPEISLMSFARNVH
jgi:hypothetical protein